jgi:Effector-associated domain 11/CHAT domain
MIQFNPLQDKLRDLIAANKTEQVLQELESVVAKDRELLDSVVLLKKKYTNLKRQDMLGIISFSDSNLENSRITVALLEIIGNLAENQSQSVNDFVERQGNFSNTNILYQQTKRGIENRGVDANIKIVLFISSAPNNREGLRFGRELETIRRCFQLGARGSEFEVFPELAVQPEEILRHLKRHRPAIVHISCHGSRERGMYFENSNGEAIPLSSDILASFFELINIREVVVECVVLSVCDSDTHAKSVHNFVNTSIGMKAAVPDAFAISYAEGFYTGLAEGDNYEDAHEHGKHSMRIKAQSLEYDGETPLNDIPVIYSINTWRNTM